MSQKELQEPSFQDISVQAQILRILKELKAEHGLSYLLLPMTERLQHLCAIEFKECDGLSVVSY